MTIGRIFGPDGWQEQPMTFYKCFKNTNVFTKQGQAITKPFNQCRYIFFSWQESDLRLPVHNSWSKYLPAFERVLLVGQRLKSNTLKTQHRFIFVEGLSLTATQSRAICDDHSVGGLCWQLAATVQNGDTCQQSHHLWSEAGWRIIECECAARYSSMENRVKCLSHDIRQVEKWIINVSVSYRFRLLFNWFFFNYHYLKQIAFYQNTLKKFT